MHIRFWGVRGSLPSPHVSTQIESNIAALIEQITVADIKTPETRKQFLAGLPPWLTGTVGGNTACISLALTDPQTLVVFDAGSGIRELGIALAQENPKINTCHLFFSHFHWDHIMGLPFFGPAYDPSAAVDFYSPVRELETILKQQMVSPYFPVSMDVMGSKKSFHHLAGTVSLDNAIVSYRKMNHPGDSYSYLVDDGKHRFIYATDVELSSADFTQNKENTDFFAEADLMVIDAQYTPEEASKKYDWGHNAFGMAVEFAVHWGVKHLVLFHHDPAYSDQKLYTILETARLHSKTNGMQVTLATEGLEIYL